MTRLQEHFCIASFDVGVCSMQWTDITLYLSELVIRIPRCETLLLGFQTQQTFLIVVTFLSSFLSQKYMNTTQNHNTQCQQNSHTKSTRSYPAFTSQNSHNSGIFTESHMFSTCVENHTHRTLHAHTNTSSSTTSTTSHHISVQSSHTSPAPCNKTVEC